MRHRTFENMPVWQLAMEIVCEVYTLTESLPKKGRLCIVWANEESSNPHCWKYYRRIREKTFKG